MKYGAVIMAGGNGRRLGGINKAELMLGDKSFLERIYDELSDFGEILVSVQDEAQSISSNYKAVYDLYPGCGPMGGILSALAASKSDALLVVSCDMPLFGSGLSRRLVEEMDTNTDALVCASSDGRVHPLCGVYTKACLPALHDCIKEGNYKMSELLLKVNSRRLKVEADEYMLKNINTFEDIENLYLNDAGCKVLPGKRNTVFLLTERIPQVVIKVFNDKANLENELSIIETLRNGGLTVSTAKRVGNNILELEYMPGITALELFEGLEAENRGFTDVDCNLCNEFSEWLVSFYSLMDSKTNKTICLNDMNLRNFIYQPEKERFVGIDFELCGENRREYDVGMLMAYILSYDPINTTYKRDMAKYMLESLVSKLDLERDVVLEQCRINLKKMQIRRKNRRMDDSCKKN